MSKEEIEKRLKEVTDKIVEKYQPEKIILFGSYAWGEPSNDSDIDLFIVKETENTRITAREIDSSILSRSFPIDLIVYTPRQVDKWEKLGEPFLSKIINQGKLLYEG